MHRRWRGSLKVILSLVSLFWNYPNFNTNWETFGTSTFSSIAQIFVHIISKLWTIFDVHDMLSETDISSHENFIQKSKSSIVGQGQDRAINIRVGSTVFGINLHRSKILASQINSMRREIISIFPRSSYCRAEFILQNWSANVYCSIGVPQSLYIKNE